MTNLRKVVFLVASALIFAASTWASASANAAAWVPSPVSQDEYGFSVSDLAYGPETFSHLMGLSTQQVSGMPNEYICDDGLSGNCDPSRSSLQAIVVLPPCQGAESPNCIADLKLGKEGIFETATLMETTGGNGLKASSNVGLPEGGTPSLWATKGDPSTPYVVLAVMKLNWATDGFVPTSLAAEVVPYELKSGAFAAPTAMARILENGRSAVGFQADPECIWQDFGRCGVRQDYAPGVKVQLSLRISRALGGWFRGRLSHPDFTVTSSGASQNVISVSGSPATIPQLQATVGKNEASAEIKELFSPKNMPGYVGGSVGLQSSYPNAPDFANAFRKIANDTAAGLLTDWSFATVGSTANPCLSDTSKVLGLVTTNSSIYDGQAPQFANGALLYHVGGYHLLPDDSLNLGTYDLIMRKETARCLYGFSSAPISASVSVTSESGKENVATTNFTETGDWDHFTAYGFTFSNPKISVKLSQSGGTNVAPLPVSAKRTIWCSNGKVSKVVTAVNPKCSKGWKVIAKPKG